MVYWTTFQFREWQVTLAATEGGLCYVGLAEDSEQRLNEWCNKQLGEIPREKNASKLAVYANEVAKYLAGVQTDFSNLSIVEQGTPFQTEVWRALSEIPYGETVSYSVIANRLGKPSAVRAVASAIGKNPLLLVVPCHRVVGKDGSVSGYRDGVDRKARLLRLENSSIVVG
ncbi:methylated-DNA--[protein]-cysteine S-methyltransferase [Sporosarcina sp. PTS2304]|uniref:methylated-DNA--[protein]-cysteine S-methyltransferase n=1 Tax=Sporosarcina sp. PTS2304 TaxID=2283194 RepID=UPI000E0DF72E|nr:methylated-DNA--[protein]-cysteine S-methyltransferase [Sporosarcina sp. PTS2304]AXI00083.1 methylated-DNA--[protein]-cysteine S-methyltransferase [Sporosarcina sp. PTS2304]